MWRDTAVMWSTEFGRTAAVNGTRGTDHGTAAAPSSRRRGRRRPRHRRLARASRGALYQGRDLRPTLDLRCLLGILEEHLAYHHGRSTTDVFPDSGAAKPLRGLIRT